MSKNLAAPKAPSTVSSATALDKALAGLRPQLGWLVDELIPADRDLNMPSASEAGVVDTYLRQALLKRDDMMEAFLAAVSRLPPERPADPLRALRSLGEASFDCCTRVVAGAYFANEAVNRILMYPGQQAIVAAPDYDFIMGAIESVAGRGAIYIPTPAADS